MTVGYGQNYLEYKPATKVPYKLPETKEAPVEAQTSNKSNVDVEPLFNFNAGFHPNLGLNAGAELGIKVNNKKVSNEITFSLQRVNMQNQARPTTTQFPIASFAGSISNKLIFKTNTKSPLENSLKTSIGFIQNASGIGENPKQENEYSPDFNNDLLLGAEYNIKKLVTTDTGALVSYGAGVSGAYALGVDDRGPRGESYNIFPYVQAGAGNEYMNFNAKVGYNFTGSQKGATNPDPYYSPFGGNGVNGALNLGISIDKIYQAISKKHQ